MFRIFSQFNTLFVRPKIRGAIQEYQTRLIESVKDDIRALRQKFTNNYRNSQAFHMSQMRDFPSVSSAITWARQIERQLVTYMRRVEDVLGKGWESYAEGHKLQVESQSFRDKLNTRPLYDAWVAEITRRGNLTVSGRLFDVVRVGGQPQLIVQFDPQVIALFKEVRSLIWLGFPVSLTISHRAKDAKRVYPHAVSLMESVRTYTQTIEQISSHPDAMLLASYRATAQAMITKGINMQWDHLVNAFDGRYDRESRHFVFVREFASTVSLLQDKATALVETSKEIDTSVAALETCEYTSESFGGHLASIQKTVSWCQGFALTAGRPSESGKLQQSGYLGRQVERPHRHCAIGASHASDPALVGIVCRPKAIGSRSAHPQPSHLPRPTNRVRASKLVVSATGHSGRGVQPRQGALAAVRD